MQTWGVGWAGGGRPGEDGEEGGSASLPGLLLTDAGWHGPPSQAVPSP